MRDKVVKDDVLDEGAEQLVEPKIRLTERIHRLNVRWPWLKILMVVMLMTMVATGIVMILQRDVGQTVSEETEVNEQEEQSVETENEVVVPDEKGTEPEEDESGATPEGDSETSGVPGAENSGAVNVPQNTGRKIVALTFDDGPSASTTSALLDVLAAKQVKVTFFVLGNMAQRSPALIQREVAEGHEVESHTMSHQNLAKISGAAIQGEVTGVDTVLQEITGSTAKLVRPPYGSINDTVRANIGRPMILWTVDPEDWKYRDAATVRTNVVSKTFDGAIVLMHDIYNTTVEAVGAIIDDLRAAGYEFLTVSEMAAERGVVLQSGYSYGSFRP